FSNARWCPDELGLLILEVIVARLLDPGVALVVVIDDTLLHRFGRKVHACFYHHDATANSDRPAVAWGNNWVCDTRSHDDERATRIGGSADVMS
ncbi:MAG: hypothetical protein LC808_03945, partial [Actinobacteria bacterium]|nr:hypothetical protein [Actinomycetota bacterium]